MKALTLVPVLALILTGCSAGVRPQFYERALEVCKPNGGLHHVKADWVATGRYFVQGVCNNGMRFDFNAELKQ